MRDHLVRWHDKYQNDGLVIIEVDGGKYEKLDVVTQAIRDKRVEFPVLWDEQCQNTERYGVRAWPVAYLIGVDGKVIWEGNPARVINRKKPRQQLVGLLENELSKVKSKSAATSRRK